MNFYMHIWPNGKTSILDAESKILWTFPNATATQHACKDWYYIQESPDDGDRQTGTTTLLSLTPFYRAVTIREADQHPNVA